MGLDINSKVGPAVSGLNRAQRAFTMTKNAAGQAASRTEDLNAKFISLQITGQSLLAFGHQFQRVGMGMITGLKGLYMTGMEVGSMWERLNLAFEAMWGEKAGKKMVVQIKDYARMTQFATRDLANLVISMKVAGDIDPFKKLDIGAAKEIVNTLDFMRDIATTTAAPMFQMKFAMQEYLSSTFAEGLRSVQRRLNLPLDKESMLLYLTSKGFKVDLTTAAGKLDALAKYLYGTKKIALGIGKKAEETMAARIEQIKDTWEFIIERVFGDMYKFTSEALNNLFLVIDEIFKGQQVAKQMAQTINMVFTPFKIAIELATAGLQALLSFYKAFPKLANIIILAGVFGSVLMVIAGAVLIVVGSLFAGIAALMAFRMYVGQALVGTTLFSTGLGILRFALMKLFLPFMMLTGIMYLVWKYLLSTEAKKRGVAFFDNLKRGFVEGYKRLELELSGLLGRFMEFFPGSEAKRGPLASPTLFERGKAIANNLALGIKAGAGMIYGVTKEILSKFNLDLGTLASIARLTAIIYFSKFAVPGRAARYMPGGRFAKKTTPHYTEFIKTQEAVRAITARSRRMFPGIPPVEKVPGLAGMQERLAHLRMKVAMTELPAMGTSAAKAAKGFDKLRLTFRFLRAGVPVSTIKTLGELGFRLEGIADIIPEITKTNIKLVGGLGKQGDFLYQTKKLWVSSLRDWQQGGKVLERLSEQFPKLGKQLSFSDIKLLSFMETHIRFLSTIEKVKNTIKTLVFGTNALSKAGSTGVMRSIAFREALVKMGTIGIKPLTLLGRLLIKPFWILDYILRKVINNLGNLWELIKWPFTKKRPEFIDRLNNSFLFLGLVTYSVGQLMWQFIKTLGKVFWSALGIFAAIGDALEPIFDLMFKTFISAFVMSIPIINIFLKIITFAFQHISNVIVKAGKTIAFVLGIVSTILQTIMWAITSIITLVGIVVNKFFGWFGITRTLTEALGALGSVLGVLIGGYISYIFLHKLMISAIGGALIWIGKEIALIAASIIGYAMLAIIKAAAWGVTLGGPIGGAIAGGAMVATLAGLGYAAYKVPGMAARRYAKETAKEKIIAPVTGALTTGRKIAVEGMEELKQAVTAQKDTYMDGEKVTDVQKSSERVGIARSFMKAAPQW